MRSCSWTNFTSQSRIASAFNELRSTHTVPSTFSARLFRSAAWRYSYSPNSCGCSRSQLTKYRLKSWALCHGSRIRQSIGSFSGGSNVSEVLGEKGTVLQNGIYRLHQLRYGFFFRNVSSNADLPGFLHQLFALVHGENQNQRVRSEVPDMARRVQPVHFRHGDVEHDQVGFQFPGQSHRFLPWACLTAHFEAFQRCQGCDHPLPA